MLLAVKLWATAHLLANGTLADVLLFGGFLAWAVADRISVKRRPAAETHEVPAAPPRPDQRRDRARRRPGRLRRVHPLGASLADRRLAARPDRVRQRLDRRVVAVRPVGRPSHRGRAVSPQRHRLRRRCSTIAARSTRSAMPSPRRRTRRAPKASCSTSSRATRSSRRAAPCEIDDAADELEVGAALGIVIGTHRLPRRRGRRARPSSPASSSSPTARLPHAGYFRPQIRAMARDASCVARRRGRRRAHDVADPDALGDPRLRRRRARAVVEHRPSTFARRRA